MFSEKLSSSTSSFARGPAQLLPGSRSHSQHSRAADSQLRENAGSPAPPIAPSTSGGGSKVHTSPSKVRRARSYDSKLVSREMHRLGSLAYLPHYAPSLNTGIPSTTLASTSSISPPNLTPGGVDNPWGTLHVLVLPLFNGEPLRFPIEDLNQFVKRHIQSVVSNSPAKAVTTLESETSELIGSGMDTLNGKLVGVEEEKLVGRVVELWGFFWDQVLPYVEGVLLPLQTDSVLSSLYRTPKTHRNSSPTRQNGKGSSIPAYPSSSHIDVRTLALRSFRDKIILPIAPLLNTRLNILKQEGLSSETHTYPRLQQMLLVLVSQGRQPTAVSLTTPAPAPSQGELAVQHLLNVVRSGTTSTRLSGQRGAYAARTLSFLSGNVPRDRRGRIAHRPGPLSLDEPGSDLEDDTVTPRLGLGPNVEMGTRERERELLDSLRSPEPAEARQSVGGWGLGTWDEGISTREKDDDDEDEQTDLEQVQAG
ncbi:HbrB-like-domain-containing protein [Russula vinacea]|nr:HbrB-like-domain-containing protein [Russula vinacea]